LVGIDYSKHAIDHAKIMNLGNTVEWLCGDIRDQDTFDKEFDIITLIETLEHIKPEEIKTFLERAHNCLEKRGSFIVTVPSNNIMVGKKHYQHFDLNSLKNAPSPFFKVVDVSYLNRNYSLDLKLIRKLLRNRVFVLNNKKLLKWIYNYYQDHHLLASENDCRRIFVVCEKL
jgi:cyclopropane fatty-acyl-phospholipid synthase-like methyltransferase